MMTSIVAGVTTVGRPFQIQLRIPPPSRTGVDKSPGAACNNRIASSKLDLPDPLGPTRTVSAERSKSMPAGPKERKFFAIILRSIGSKTEPPAESASVPPSYSIAYL